MDDDPVGAAEMLHSIEAVLGRTKHLLSIFTLREETQPKGIVNIIQEIVTQTRLAHPKVTINLNAYEGIDKFQLSIGRLLPIVFENLIRNSIQHCGDSVTINIDVGFNNQNVEVRVSDNGPGIPSIIREHLFKKGVSTNSTGMGLYLAKSVVTAFDGTIEHLDSDVGASFLIRFPILN